MEFLLYDHSSSTRTTVEVDAEAIVIGRETDCDLVLRGPFVARRHARLARQGNTLFIENTCRSAMRVAGRDVDAGQSVRIDFGDEVEIGPYSLALMRPGRTGGEPDRERELQRRLVEFEQGIHAELIERLNLRVTARINKQDAVYVAQINENLNDIINRRAGDLDEDLGTHMLRIHLHRLVTAEVVRQCTGRVQMDYRESDTDQADTSYERALDEIASSMVDMMPLLFDPTSVQEDLAVAEEGFDDLFEQQLPSMSNALRRHIVRRVVAKDLQDIMLGLGPLQDLLDMANVTEIMVVGKDRIYVEKNGLIQPTTRSFFSDEVLMHVIERVLTPAGRRVDQSSPLVDARLADGSRVNVIIPPLSLVGPCVTIRKFAWIPFTIDDLIERETISEQCAGFLRGCVMERKNVIVSGGTGAGKTTLLNTLGAFARSTERVVTVEESAELQLPQPHVVSLEGRPANVEGRGAYTIRDLVRNALRMRPDRIIVGEVRGPEALDMLQAMNTGHDGSLSTIHANTPIDSMNRLETLILMAVDMPVRAIREQIVSAIDLVVQIARHADGHRRVTQIAEVSEIDRETDQIRMEDVFVLRETDQPRLRHTGYIPTFAEELIARGQIDVDMFL